MKIIRLAPREIINLKDIEFPIFIIGGQDFICNWRRVAFRDGEKDNKRKGDNTSIQIRTAVLYAPKDHDCKFLYLDIANHNFEPELNVLTLYFAQDLPEWS